MEWNAANYIAEQSPFGLQDPRLWSLPVVASNSIVPGQFLTGAFGEGATILVSEIREGRRRLDTAAQTELSRNVKAGK